MTTPLSRALSTFLNTYGGTEYRNHTTSEMIQVMEGFISILELSGPSKAIATRLTNKLKKIKDPARFVMAVSEEMFKLEGMGTEGI